VRILHFLGGTSVEVAGDRAVAQTKMTISQRASVDGVLCDVVCAGRFYDFFEKRDGRWGFVLRQAIYERDRLDPVDPTESVALDPELLSRLPEGYRRGTASTPLPAASSVSSLARPPRMRSGRSRRPSVRWRGPVGPVGEAKRATHLFEVPADVPAQLTALCGAVVRAWHARVARTPQRAALRRMPCAVTTTAPTRSMTAGRRGEMATPDCRHRLRVDRFPLLTLGAPTRRDEQSPRAVRGCREWTPRCGRALCLDMLTGLRRDTPACRT
jgi:hypothetical protein